MTVGETVAVTLDPTDATPTAVHVTVLLDRASGKVTAVSSTSITLSGPKDSTRYAVISPSTLYFNGKTAATGVTIGEFVTAFGTRDTSTPTDLEALFVDILPTAANPDGGPAVTPTLPNPLKPTHGDNDATEHAPTTLSTAPGGTLPTPPAGASGRGGPGASGDGNHNGVGHNEVPGGIDGHGDNSGGGSGGGNGAAGHGGRG